MTLRLDPRLPSLRDPALFAVTLAALSASAFGLFFRIVEFSVQRNHLHLLIEASDSIAASSGLKSLEARLARAVNLHLSRSGPVLADRYDIHILETPREARNALAYVLNNARKHAQEAGRTLPARWLDPRSSAAWFDGWLDARPITPTAKPVASARTWLLTRGWRRHGLLAVDEGPTLTRAPVATRARV